MREGGGGGGRREGGDGEGDWSCEVGGPLKLLSDNGSLSGVLGTWVLALMSLRGMIRPIVKGGC